MILDQAKELSGLANHLVNDGLLTLPRAKEAHNKANLLNMRFITFLVNNKILSSDVILNSCIKAFGLPSFDLSDFNPAWLANSPLNTDLIHRYHIVPLYKHNDILHIGISDPTESVALDTISFQLESKAQCVLVAEDKLNYVLDKYLKHSILEMNLIKKITTEDVFSSIQESSVQYDEPLIRFVDNIIQHAINQSASDIHIEPYETICRIRYRQDGLLYEAAVIPPELAGRLTARLKVIAKLDIAERRMPQDGRMLLFNRDIRINTCPTLFGEKIVLRILNSNSLINNLASLGMTQSQLNLLNSSITKPQGMILVTGPTGSGKTVTLYSVLNYINSIEKNISTVEDPIEIKLPGINQVNIHPKIGLSFSHVIRTLLRQDPDILMIGEIRDLETAEIAMHAAQTGHLVLSTLHTNNALDTIIRLKSMGIPAYILANTISLLVAQRLVRQLCDHCKQPEIVSKPYLTSLGIDAGDDITFYRAVGCQYCLHGYAGRTGIYELLPVSDQISELIASQATSTAIKELLQHQAFLSLKEAAFEKIKFGITSLVEMNRVLQI